MQAKDKPTSSPNTIMQAYRQACDRAGRSSNPEEKIRAYSKVIEFCANTSSCRWRPNVKRNMLLYWAHIQIAQAFAAQNKQLEALKYWRKAFVLAGTNRQKTEVFEQMIKVWGTAPVSLQERCMEIAQISGKLAEIYRIEGQFDEIERLERLQEKVLHLMKKAGS